MLHATGMMFNFDGSFERITLSARRMPAESLYVR